MAVDIAFNLDLNNDPNNDKTVGELREEFRKLEEQVDNTTQGTEEYNKAVRRLGQVQGELEKVDRAIEAMNPERKAQVIGDAVSGMAGGFQAAVASAELFGVENEAVLESLQRVNAVMAITEGITAFSEKIPAMKTLIATMPRLTSALKGARIGFQGLSTATKALGIGLLVSAVALLVTHWDDVEEVISDLLPGLDKMGGLFGVITDGAIALGKAIVEWVANPAKALIQLFTGDFEGAMESFKNIVLGPIKIAGDTMDNFNEEQAKRAEERRKKEVEEAIKIAEREKEIMEARGQDTTEISQRIFEMKKDIYDKESQEYKDLIHEQNVADAQRTRKQQEELEKRLELRRKAIQAANEARAEGPGSERPEDDILGEDIDTGIGEGEEGEELLIFNGEVMSRSKFETMQMMGQLALSENLLQQNITKEEFRNKQLENQLDAIDAELSITERGTDRYIELQQKRTEASIELANAEADAKIATLERTGQALTQLSRLAGEQTAIGKALGVVSATIDTYVGANKALAQGGIFGIVSAASVIATGLANVRQILSTKVPSIQGQPLGTPPSSPLGAGGAARQAVPPQFNETGVNTVNTVQSERDRERKMNINVNVSETEITDTQNRVQEIERQATF